MALEQRLSTSLLVAVVAGLARGTPQDTQPPPARIGELVPDHEFPRLDWHDGRTRLHQLFGHPVLVGGWKQYIPEPTGLNVAYFSNELLKDFAEDGLIVILEDRKEWSERRWWGARSFWVRFYQHPVWFAAGEPSATEDLPIVRARSTRDERSAVLIGVDGTLVYEGTITEMGEGPAGAELRAAIEREVDRREDGWGADKHLKKARALAFGAGKYGAALDSAARSEGAPQQVAQVRAEIETVVAAELASVRYLLERGRVLEAEERWEALRRGSRGADELLAQVDELAPRFEGKEAKATHQLGRRLAKMLAPLQHEEWRAFDAEAVFELRVFAEEHAEHPVGRRAARLDPLVKDLAGIARGSHKNLDAALERLEKKRRR